MCCIDHANENRLDGKGGTDGVVDLLVVGDKTLIIRLGYGAAVRYFIWSLLTYSFDLYRFRYTIYILVRSLTRMYKCCYGQGVP